MVTRNEERKEGRKERESASGGKISFHKFLMKELKESARRGAAASFSRSRLFSLARRAAFNSLYFI